MFLIDFCGTGGFMPLPQRALSSFMLSYEGRSMLFDCGEGTQVAIRRHHLGFKDIEVIWISHKHGDHVFGLPGLIATLGNTDRQTPLLIICPESCTSEIKALISLCLVHFDVWILGLNGFGDERIYAQMNAKGFRLLAIESEHPVFLDRALKALPLKKPSQKAVSSVQTHPVSAQRDLLFPRNHFEYSHPYLDMQSLENEEERAAWAQTCPYDAKWQRPVAAAYAPANLIISAYKQRHSVDCLAYRLDFLRARAFHADRAKSLGLDPKTWKQLQQGEIVDGVFPETVMPEARPGFSMVYATDTRPCAKNHEGFKGVDLLISEGTFGDPLDQAKAKSRGHMTFCEAGTQAANCEVKHLLLTHFSAAMPHPEDYLHYAKEIFKDSYLAQDGARFIWNWKDRTAQDEKAHLIKSHPNGAFFYQPPLSQPNQESDGPFENEVCV